MAAVASLISLASTRLRSARVRWVIALIFPLALSSTLYWSPVALGASALEYSTWAILVVPAWTLAGTVASVLVLAIAAYRGRARHH